MYPQVNLNEDDEQMDVVLLLSIATLVGCDG